MKNNQFSKQLINWYILNGRQFPWRETKNPYHIWLSEIILQQTQTKQGLPYYINFINKYPSISDLANARINDILKLWQGLGYYSRANNLLETAKIIQNQYFGQFPENYNEIIKLKGIGKYTAAAICSFAFDLPYAVCDGNVKRVISRLFGIQLPIDTKKGEDSIIKHLNIIFPKKNSSIFNQAIMDLGAVICTKNKPKCSICCFSSNCIAHLNNTTIQLPVKSKKIKIENRFIYYLIILNNNKVWLRKRNTDNLWKNLFDFPSIESNTEIELDSINSEEKWQKIFNNQKIHIHNISESYTHRLSHLKIYATFIQIHANIQFNSPLYFSINLNELNQYPTSRLIENYIKNHPLF